METRYLLTGLEQGYNSILGLPWLKEHNPMVDWENNKLDIDLAKQKPTIGLVLCKGLEIQEF